MTGPEHYERAERLLAEVRELDLDDVAETIAIAQVHATLALAAATALNDANGGMAISEHRAWVQAVCQPPRETGSLRCSTGCGA